MGLGRILITEEELRERVSQMGKEISADYRGKIPTIVGVLKGAVVFLSDLLRKSDLRAEFDFLGLSSYRGAARSGVRVTQELSAEVSGKDVIVVDGIVDTGLTLQFALERLTEEDPSSLEVCCLLDKRSNRKIAVPLRYVGFEIPDLFVVGYGLDYEEHYRNLPYVAVFDR